MKYAVLAFLAAPLFADASSTVYLPHIVDGGSWRTTFTIVNLATFADGEAVIHLWAEDGSPLALSFAGEAGAPKSQITVVVPPHGVVTLETSGDPAKPTAVGWADMDVRTSGHLALSALMRQRVPGRPDYEVFVPSRPIATATQVFVFDQKTSASGFGMMNASRVNTALVDVTIRNENGLVIQNSSLSLPPGGHDSFDLSSRFPASAGQRGTIEFAPQPGGWFAVIGLRFNPTGPITSLEAMIP